VTLVDDRFGAADPADAIDEELSSNPEYSWFIISKLPEEKSRWLRMGLPRKVGAAYGLPVHHVVATRDFSLGDLP